ncbi:MAG: hypothetical protein WCK11_05665 [Candidatus Falkowbacteria bacterium]
MNFWQRYKKFTYIVGFIIVVIGLGYLLYVIFFKPLLSPATPISPTATSTPPGGGLPPSGKGTGGQIIQTGTSTLPGTSQIPEETKPDPLAKGNVTKTDTISQDNTLKPTLTGDGKSLQYYNQNDGKFYRVTADGKAELLSDKVFYDVQNIVWSPQKTEAVLEYPDGSKIIYNFADKNQITLPSHWQDFNYAPSGNQLVFKSMGQDPDNRWLAVVNSDGSKAQRIEELGENGDKVYDAWSPNGQVAALYAEGVDFNRQEVFFVGLNGENFKSTIVEGRGFIPQWSPKGNQLLYSVYSTDTDLKPNLWIVNAEGDQIGSNRRNLGVATWANKCSFSDNTTIYCAVPKSLEQGSGLFPELADATTDDLYAIDATTGQKRRIAIPEGDYNITNLILSQDGKNLFFSDKATNNLHKIQLK